MKKCVIQNIFYTITIATFFERKLYHNISKNVKSSHWSLSGPDRQESAIFKKSRLFVKITSSQLFSEITDCLQGHKLSSFSINCTYFQFLAHCVSCILVVIHWLHYFLWFSESFCKSFISFFTILINYSLCSKANTLTHQIQLQNRTFCSTLMPIVFLRMLRTISLLFCWKHSVCICVLGLNSTRVFIKVPWNKVSAFT